MALVKIFPTENSKKEQPQETKEYAREEENTCTGISPPKKEEEVERSPRTTESGLEVDQVARSQLVRR